jgi:predicted metal-dependent phosphoesterase TrpH
VSVDLHTHTKHSDGTLGPAELVRLAHAKNLTAIAVTDHDITCGNTDAISHGQELGVKVVPGLELSVNSDLPAKGHLHMLGLFIDHDHPILNRSLQKLRQGRLNRNQKILNRLKELGVPISSDDLNSVSGIGAIGRPHIATAMVKKGYVKNSREAFNQYLKKGATAYFDRMRLGAEQAIDLIHLSGGIALIAHPVSLGFSSFSDAEEYIIELKNIGLDGIEVHCPGQNKETIQTMLNFAGKNDLVISGGSDYHGSVKPETQLGSGRGDLDIPDQVYWDLLDYWEKKN